ncbi:MAG: ribose-5-phosphate isomerase RpiA [Methylophilaceae bacterium]|jgi:ribose 5-phosphate isomerase A|uniref:ribose-5-phosphate isomerase RpiA n=1 Tax=Methylobacillus sp. MM3 TaxID=1848039 RepID=UPI0007DF6697|nr:ribose-5-phosphate isomerase RpiA [Methylobacillus sp. MM3]OAJ71761.1 ribose 5-phosphate isomerase A [Methylobacillus sp. MM3]
MNDKELVAYQAARLVEDGMLVGLGTGSTANYFIEELARRKSEEGLEVSTVSSSVISAIKAQSLGLPLVAMEHVSRLDLYVDGADEVTPDMTLLKGRGSDLVREKLLARAADRFIVLVDQSKLVSRIGEKFPIPIEVVPFAWQLAKRTLESLGGRGGLRQNASKDGLAVTSHGSLVLDMVFDSSIDSQALNGMLNATPGVVEHGIFQGLAAAVFVAQDGRVEERWNGK